MAYWLRPCWPGIRLCAMLTLFCTLVTASAVPGLTNAANVGHASSTTISVFYPATKATLDAWSATTSTARPAETTTFGAGTTLVAFYFEYAGATPNRTQYTIVIFSQGGGLFLRHGPYVFTHVAALHMSPVPALHGAYPAGRYHAELLIDGQVMATADFTVRGVSGATVTIFYPATRAAYDAWEAASSDAPPARTTSFGAGTTTITFYFAFHGARANVTPFEIVLRNHQGAQVATHGPYTLSLGAGLHMSKVTMPSGAAFPDGAYRADLVVDGHVAVSTFFSVGAQQTAQACRAGDGLATCVVPSVLRLHANLANNMEAEGTGFVIQSDASGTYLLTNKHVIDGATPASMVALSPDGHTQYRVLAIQATSAEEGTAGDLAVVKLPPSALHPLTWGDSTHLHLLQPVISVGYGDAFDLTGPPSVTEGSISALGRDMGDGYGPVWIQHQSFINHGNSGGPLLDEQYEVVGVNTLSMKNTQGIFLAIPSALARKIARTLIAQLQGQ